MFPAGEGGGIGEEEVELGLGDAGLAGAVGLGAEAGDDVIDDGLELGVVGGVRGEDAVAVEFGLGEDFGGVGGVFRGDGGGVGFAEVGEDLSGGGEKLGAFRGGVVDGGEREGGAPEWQYIQDYFSALLGESQQVSREFMDHAKIPPY